MLLLTPHYTEKGRAKQRPELSLESSSALPYLCSSTEIPQRRDLPGLEALSKASTMPFWINSLGQILSWT